MKNKVKFLRYIGRVRVLLLLCLLVLAPMQVMAGGLDGKLVILTPFPQEATDLLRRAFLRQHPDVDVEIRHKSAAESLRLLDGMAGRTVVDLYWGGSPDTFEMLRKAGLLEVARFHVAGIPDHLGKIPLSDPKGFYTGVSASGYGFMWNTRYLNAKQLGIPTHWSDLARPEYQGHVAMSSAFRSSATHLVIETILQTQGWKKGWALIRAIGGNLKTVTKTGFNAAVGVQEGDFGIGITSDSFAISSRDRLYPVGFRYPSDPIIMPTSIGILKGSPNRKAAEGFIDFLLSDTAQYLLTDKHIARLPIRPEVYKSVPDDFPDPFAPAVLSRSVDFDIETSVSRYALVNSMFDVIVTFNLASLRRATTAVIEAQRRLSLNDIPSARLLLKEAQKLLTYLPVDEMQSKDAAFVAQFSQDHILANDTVRKRGVQLEIQWTETLRKNYIQAKLLAERALKLLDKKTLASD